MKKYIFPLLILLLGCGTDDDIDDPVLEEEEFSSDLFFSEYVEGTSFNKALEIVNLKGETIDLEAEGYSIKKQSNGSGNWMSELGLSGNLEHNDVFVIANELAEDPGIVSNADQLKTGAPMDFNGNDPVGLFKNDVLIDIIGEMDNPEDFAKDVTLRRSFMQTEPSSTFILEQWEFFDVNNTEDLGMY